MLEISGGREPPFELMAIAAYETENNHGYCQRLSAYQDYQIAKRQLGQISVMLSSQEEKIGFALH
ncbi:MAG: hypothetical protein WCF20_04710 [Methylovirgula sp.]